MKYKVTFKKEVGKKRKSVDVLFSADTYGNVEEQFFKYCEENEIPMGVGEYVIRPTTITDLIINKECGIWYLITCIEVDIDDKEFKRYVLIESDNDINARKEIEEIVEVKSISSTKFVDVICQ